jgi:hypothetical protein
LISRKTSIGQPTNYTIVLITRQDDLLGLIVKPKGQVAGIGEFLAGGRAAGDQDGAFFVAYSVQADVRNILSDTPASVPVHDP